jgi:hypothetical protein
VIRPASVGLGQSTAATGADVPWWCGSAIMQLFPASMTPSCYPNPPSPVLPGTSATPEQAAAANQAQNQQFFGSLASQLPDLSLTTSNTPAQPSECSTFMGYITSPISCWGQNAPLSVWLAIGAAGFILLKVITR